MKRFMHVRSTLYLPHFLRIDHALFNIVMYLDLYNTKFNQAPKAH